MMSKKTRARLLSLFLLLGVLAGVLATPDSESAQATMCCESCQFMYESCVANSNQSPCYGDQMCCADRADQCMWTCYWC